MSAITLTILFRSQAVLLLGRLSRLKTPVAEFDFADKLDAAEKSLPLLLKGDSQPVGLPVQLFDPSLPPGYIILRTWKRLNDRLGTLAYQRGIVGPGGKPTDWIIDNLDLEPALKYSIKELEWIRNGAVHFHEPHPTTLDALRYIDLVDQALESLPRPDPNF